jgi:fucose permease
VCVSGISVLLGLIFISLFIYHSFEPSIAATAESISQRVKNTSGSATTVAMVGGFIDWAT